jgi:hypothetical protein
MHSRGSLIDSLTAALRDRRLLSDLFDEARTMLILQARLPACDISSSQKSKLIDTFRPELTSLHEHGLADGDARVWLRAELMLCLERAFASPSARDGRAQMV